MLHMMVLSQGRTSQTITLPDSNIILCCGVYMGCCEGLFDQEFYIKYIGVEMKYLEHINSNCIDQTINEYFCQVKFFKSKLINH